MKIGILGAGTWGTALAGMLYKNGHTVTVWSAISEEVKRLDEKREHVNLPGVTLPDDIVFTEKLEAAAADKDIVVFAVPSVYVRSVSKSAARFIPPAQIVVSVAKGIEPDTFFTMTDVIGEELNDSAPRLVALSGPTHAEEVARDLPTTIVAASVDDEAARAVVSAFSGRFMRVYTNRDIKGVELCGALKNVIALAAGVSDGIGYGDNAKAAVITRGMAEICRLGRAMGCDERTFYGLAGVGDLIVTATSRHSRNNRCGNLMGRGVPAKEAVRQVGMVVEGINALPAAMGLSKLYGVEMPIAFAVNELVNGGDVKKIAESIMKRAYKNESMAYGD